VLRLYFSPGRSSRVTWLLEELGVRYEIELVDLQKGEHLRPEFLVINPSGKVPALVADDHVIFESGAICTWLADRYPEARLAPQTSDPLRGRYLSWMFYAAGVVEPSFSDHARGRSSEGVGWAGFESVVSVLSDVLASRAWLCGELFTAADVMIGSMLLWANQNDFLQDAEELRAYCERLQLRPALQRADELDRRMLERLAERSGDA
jgi:glutathione S-transferase